MDSDWQECLLKRIRGLLGRLSVPAEMALAPELGEENNQSDEQPRPQVRARQLESAGYGKLHQEHQGKSKNSVHHGRNQRLPTGFQVGSHSSPLVDVVKRIIVY